MKSIKALGDTNFPFDMLETYMKRVSDCCSTLKIETLNPNKLYVYNLL